MSSERRSTLEDVARLAGVSLGSASRALSIPDQVKPSTLEKVRQAVAQLGYVRQTTAARPRLIMTNNFAFGGVNTSILVKAVD